MKAIKQEDLVPIDDSITGLSEQIFFRDENNNIFAYTTEICRFVGYVDPKSRASQIFSKEKEKLSQFSTVADFATEEGLRKARISWNEGIHYFIMQLDRPLAKDLQLAYARIVEKYRRGELELLTDPLQRSLVIIDQLKRSVEIQIQHQEQLDDHSERMDSLEQTTQQLVEELVKITGNEKWRIAQQIKELVWIGKRSDPNRSEGQLRASFYGLLKDYFQVNSYAEIPHNSFDDAMTVLHCMRKAALKGNLDLSGYISVNYIKKLCGESSYYPQKQTELKPC